MRGRKQRESDLLANLTMNVENKSECLYSSPRTDGIKNKLGVNKIDNNNQLLMADGSVEDRAKR